MEDEQLGLELNSSRGNSYNDLVEAVAVATLSPNRKLIRPPSYSDSFIILGNGNGTGLAANGKVALAAIPLAAGSLTPTIGSINANLWQPLLPLAPAEALANQTDISAVPLALAATPTEAPKLNKLLSILTHITLISVFETVFYFNFISKSEDNGIQNTINQFLQGTLSQCRTWPQNTTQLLSALLQLVVNETQIASAAVTANNQRTLSNQTLQVQSWMYVVSLASTVISIAIAAHCKKYKINWRSIIVENIVLVCLLGAYEAFFFETIIYMYQSLTLPELEQSILQQLHSSCGI
jgi:hypothetical protein